MKRFLLLALPVAAAACSTVPSPEAALPGFAEYSFPAADAATQAGAVTETWYESAVSQDLAAFLGGAQTTSPAILQQEQRVAQAEASLKSAEAARWFDIALTGSASGTYDFDTESSSDSSRAALGLDLPLDVNGRLRTLRNAARHNLNAAEARYDLTRNTTLRDLSVSVVDAAEASLLEQLIEAQIENSRTLLQLTELRFAQGQASIVDVLQQRDQIASLEQQLPPLRTSRLSAIDRIATATGAPPAGDDAPALLADIPAISDIQSWPAANSLVTTRPDLRASVEDLRAANASYTAAVLNRLPSFSLSGSAASSLASGDASEFVSATLSGALTVFDSGTKSAAVERNRAAYEESAIVLLQDWLGALAEINGLMNQESEGVENIRLAEERLETSRELLESARRRYRQGASDYLPVLDALSSIQTQERRLISLQAQQARIRIRLHAALGLPVEPNSERTI